MTRSRPLRILAILEAGDLYPSGTIRALIYREHFERAGIDARFAARLHVPTLRLINRPPRWLRVMLRFGYGVRLMDTILRKMTARTERALLAEAKKYDVVYMSKVTSASFVENLRRATAARLVLDFGDAIWLPRYGFQDFDRLVRAVDAVTTDNPVTADYVRQFNSQCTVIPDCPQVEEFDRRRVGTTKGTSEGRILLGWIGSRSTAYNLYVVWEALERVFKRHDNIELRIVGASPGDLPPFERVRYSCVPDYDQARMIDEVLKMDIGLFPLQDVDACRVRGVLKAAVYMSGEVAAVCSPIGQSADFIRDGLNGMLARSTDEWESKLARLISDEALRHSLARAGLETARSQFTVDKSFALLKAVLEGPGRIEKLMPSRFTDVADEALQ
jgi:glycosyltransferase involved in cell wall biosynthesis